MRLFIAELNKRWAQAKAYPMEEVAAMFIFVALFYGLILGSHYLSGGAAQPAGRLTAAVIGYVAWLLVFRSLSGVSSDLSSEARTGTLQQLIMSKYSSWKIFLTRSLADSTVNIVTIVAILFVITMISGVHLQLSLILVVPMLAVIVGSTGLGLLLGALVFVAKRIDILGSIVTFGLLFVIMAPFETFTGAAHIAGYVLPIAPCVGVIRQLTAATPELNPLLLTVAILNAAFYFLIGLACFVRAERHARKRGNIGAF